MASSLYSNAQHVDFDSVLAMDDPGMVSMFEALEASGLRGFLGCPAVVYEDALVDFFENASVRNGVVFSTVGGQIVKISEELFAESFELPVEGLGDLSEMPKDAIFDARSIVSLYGEQINLSGRKNQMKMPYRLLCDIVAKAISVKAGSFNAITVEKFSLMTAVVCGVKMNWAKFLFGILKKMVAVKTKQAKGFAIQISLLLEIFPDVELGEASEFPASKILSKKTVLRFISINDRDGAEEIKEAAKKKDVSKKRTAADIEAAIPKKKRTSKKKSLSSISSLEMVAVAEEALVVEPLDIEEPRCSSADAVDLIIQQVLDETRADDAPADTTEAAVNVEKNWFDLPYEDIVKQWEAERPVVTASDTEDDDVATADVAPADPVQQVEEIVAPLSAEEELSEDEKTSLDDILLSIPVDIPLPSTCMEVTQIKMGQMIKIPGVTKWTWFLKQLPRIPAEDKGKELLVEKDPVRGNPAKEHYSLICADIELLVNLRAQAIDEVASFFSSFSLRKLSSINFEEMYSKEEQVLRWGETESPQIAIQRKFYILLKYRTILVWKFLDAWRINFAPGQGSTAVDIQVIELLSALHLSLLEELAKEARILGLTWTKPCCSSVVEGSPRDRGAVLARSNCSTRSLCWIRRMFLVEGAWKVEQCADMWVKIPKKVESTEVPLQRQYDDTLPTMSVFFKLMRKRWADVCLEAVEFCVQRLLPVGSIRACRSLQLSASVSSFDSRRPTVFELRVSQIIPYLLI
ncbi:dystroglycan-like [Dorcoceras hygrometricum]|uniref:Dystroglycan-like n=1 Tax=Dorcoceras hygrometricum TaxID=472368 RepID=A0A2Z7AKZ5_9LAMI|nr:dystroglycan-like [Dorcoceras hygrometricum]